MVEPMKMHPELLEREVPAGRTVWMRYDDVVVDACQHVWLRRTKDWTYQPDLEHDIMVTHDGESAVLTVSSEHRWAPGGHVTLGEYIPVVRVIVR